MSSNPQTGKKTYAPEVSTKLGSPLAKPDPKPVKKPKGKK